jgi:hypothetical protein
MLVRVRGVTSLRVDDIVSMILPPRRMTFPFIVKGVSITES